MARRPTLTRLLRGEQFDAQAKRSLAQAPTTDPTTFMTAACTAQDALEAGLEGIQAAFSAARTADAAPLLKAFAANDDCQNVAD